MPPVAGQRQTSSPKNNVLSRFVRIALQAYNSSIPLWEAFMSQRAPRETTIERIYREVTGRKMPRAVRRILLSRRRFRHYKKTNFGV